VEAEKEKEVEKEDEWKMEKESEVSAIWSGRLQSVDEGGMHRIEGKETLCQLIRRRQRCPSEIGPKSGPNCGPKLWAKSELASAAGLASVWRHWSRSRANSGCWPARIWEVAEVAIWPAKQWRVSPYARLSSAAPLGAPP